MDPVLRERIRAFVDAVPAAVAVCTFGSVARGEDRSDSDVDVRARL